MTVDLLSGVYFNTSGDCEPTWATAAYRQHICFLLIYTWKIFWFQNSVEQVQCFSLFLSKYLIWQTKVETIGQTFMDILG